MFNNYKKLLFASLSLFVSHVSVAQEANRELIDSVQNTEQVVIQKDKDWEKLYSMRSVFLFDRVLMDEETGVYSAYSGFSGNAGLLMLRGVTSVNLNTSPFVMVDGLPMRHVRNMTPFASGVFHSNLNFINPLDIANMKVIKNGYDNVFYGGRAGNGIIDINIDKGDLGSATIDVSVKMGVTDADISPSLMNAAEYRQFLYTMMRDKGYSAGELQINLLFDPTLPMYSHDNYWPSLFNQKGMFSDVHFKMKGGDGDTRYLFSMGHTSEEGVLKNVNDQRINMRFNLDFRITPKVRIETMFSYNYGSNRFFSEGINWKHNPLFIASAKAPFMSSNYYSEDDIMVDQLADIDALGMTNPAALEDGLENKGLSNKIDAVVKGFLNIDSKTFLNGELMMSYNSLTEKLHQKATGIAMDRYIERQNSKRSYSEYLMRARTWMERTGMVTEDIAYTSSTGFSLDIYKEKMIYGRKVNAASDDVESVEGGKLADSLGNISYDHNLMNVYLSGGLTWRDNLKLGASFNLERSSNFGANGAWNLYAGGELRWTVLRTASEGLELYAQYGRNGNNEVRGGYYARLYRPTFYYTYGAVYLGTVRNDNLKPEYTNNYDLGLNATLFNDRLNLGAAYYYRKTVGLITQKSLPIEIGLDPQYENNGDAINHGIELSVAVDLIKSDEISWNLFATLSTLSNKLENLKNGDVIRKMDKYTGIAREGEELGSFYGYKVKGIFSRESDVDLKKSDGTMYQAGDYKMEDVNEDNTINELDRQIIGSPIPEFYGGFGTNLTWKDLSFVAIFSYSYGNDVYNLFRQQTSEMTDFSNQNRDVLQRWVSEDHPGDGWLPRSAYGDPSGNFETSDRWVEDGSYLKLKSIAIQYNIPLNRRSSFIKGIQVSLNCNNLWTLSGYSGFDPEVFSEMDPLLRGVDTGATPTPRSYVFGLNVSF